jgi:hypothetical protein
VSFSDTVRALRERGLVETTVAVGACVQGDVACVSTAAAFVWAAEQGFDAVLCSIGPGIVGTASPWGHGGLSVAEAVLTARALGGAPVLAVRYSEGDPRERHRGLSEGLESPDGLERANVVDVSGWRDACAGLPLSHMGRGADDDPWFFAAAYAAGRVAFRHLA